MKIIWIAHFSINSRLYWTNSLKYFAQGTMLKCFLKNISLYCILISINWSHNIMMCLFFFYTYIFHKCCANLWCICGKAKIIHLGFFFQALLLNAQCHVTKGNNSVFLKKNFPPGPFQFFWQIGKMTFVMETLHVALFLFRKLLAQEEKIYFVFTLINTERCT